MQNKSAAREYARAIMHFAGGSFDTIMKLFKAIVDRRAIDSGYDRLLLHPAISSKEKLATVMSLCDDEIPDLIVRILSDLVKRRSLGQLSQIMVFMDELNEARMNIQDAEVVSTGTLTDDEKKKITAAIAKHTGKNPRVHYRMEKGLIAGMKVKIGDQVLDNTVKRQLEVIGDTLKAATRV